MVYLLLYLFYILCTLSLSCLLRLVCHVLKDSLLKWSWWKLRSVLNQKKLTWNTDFIQGLSVTFCKLIKTLQCGFVNGLTTSSSILCLYSIYLVAMLPFKMILFWNVFRFISFSHDLQYFSPLLQDSFVIFNENLLQSRIEEGKKDFIKKNGNNNFYGAAYFVYYRCF